MKKYISKKYIDSILTLLLNDSRGAEHYAYDCVKYYIDHAPSHETVNLEEDGNGRS